MSQMNLSLSLRSQLLMGGIDAYAIVGLKPAFVADFDDEYYRAVGGGSTFSDAITHSASSNATMVDSDGLLKWRPHNLLRYSEQFDNAAWVKGLVTVTANAAVAPDGAQTADNVVGNSGVGERRVYKSSLAPSTVGVSYTTTVYAKANGANWLVIRDDLAGYADTSFDLINGVVGTVASGRTASIESVGNGFYACTLSVTVTGSFVVGQIMFCLADADNGRATFSGDGVKGIYLWGAHFYRSDLGGMVAVPADARATPSATTYVPTTSSAVYLPRRGHHVYNGTSWVNEGLLHESEQRVNLLTYSEQFDNAYWVKASGATVSANAVISPDGTQNADTLVCPNSSDTTPDVYVASLAVTSGAAYTFSVWLKGASNGAWPLNVYNGASHNPLVVNVTTEWQRFVITVVASGTTMNVYLCDKRSSVSGSNTYLDSVDAYGAQLEAGSTPSSYIPTSGATVTRAAETLTIPSAKLPWPTPNVIGPELVTNGTFDTDVSGWAGFAGATLSHDAARLALEVSGDGSAYVYSELLGLTAGKVYEVSFDLLDSAVVTTFGFGDSGTVYSASASVPGAGNRAVGTYSAILVATADGRFKITHGGGNPQTFSVDNISVREIDPLAVSIQMQGRMTYADTGVSGEVTFSRWLADADNLIDLKVDTVSTLTGRYTIVQRQGAVSDFATSSDTYYFPGINVPFNIAARHGSTFVNGAVDGTALTANTTPTALPDLSSTDLQLGFDYMGTIKLFRIWADDLTDAGLEQSTS